MKKNLLYVLGIGFLIGFILLINALIFSEKKESTQIKIIETDIIYVGMETKFPPFETIDATGKPSGVSVDFAHAIGQKINKKIEFVTLDWASLIPGLQTKKIDMIISSMTITPEREQTISFSDEYARSDLALAINKKNQISDIQELNKADKTIAVKQGTLGEIWAEKNLPLAKKKAFTEVSAALLDVNNGQSDAFIYDPLTLLEGTKSMSQIKLKLDPLPGVSGWGVGMRKEDQQLKNSVNQAIIALKKEGFFDQMRAKYLKEDVEKYESYGLKYFF